jgi:hypothetical protein
VALNGLEVSRRINDRTFEELPAESKRHQDSPTFASSAYCARQMLLLSLSFQRLNTGGVLS